MHADLQVGVGSRIELLRAGQGRLDHGGAAGTAQECEVGVLGVGIGAGRGPGGGHCGTTLQHDDDRMNPG
ncbi:hypothetical protein [Sanguibacter sp. Z1732]|uniref:hypothetical protein n=1 Tax=Sanguibacter sp. Z1732 TaxID=3435412 RepID=UPI003D9C88D6